MPGCSALKTGGAEDRGADLSVLEDKNGHPPIQSVVWLLMSRHAMDPGGNHNVCAFGLLYQ